jgi:hypothetical protein
MDCVFVEMVAVECTDPDHLRCDVSVPPHERVVDFRTVMKAQARSCLVMTTYKTMQTLVQHHTDLFEVYKEDDSEYTVHLVKQFLSSPTVKPKKGLS